MSFLQNKLQSYKIILASESPRRASLLNSLDLDFQIITSDADETIPNEVLPHSYCQILSTRKAKSVHEKIITTFNENLTLQKYIIIAADTIVFYKNKVLNKPKDAEEAIATLKMLSGQTHSVFTGLTVIFMQGLTYSEQTNSFRTDVTFRSLYDEEIYDYVATGSPLDKAGSYGIQDDYGASFVCKIEGNYSNVVGLPLSNLVEILTKKLSS